MELRYIAKHGDAVIKAYSDPDDWLILSEGDGVKFMEVWRSRHRMTLTDKESFDIAISAAFKANEFDTGSVEVIMGFSS